MTKRNCFIGLVAAILFLVGANVKADIVSGVHYGNQAAAEEYLGGELYKLVALDYAAYQNYNWDPKYDPRFIAEPIGTAEYIKGEFHNAYAYVEFGVGPNYAGPGLGFALTFEPRGGVNYSTVETAAEALYQSLIITDEFGSPVGGDVPGNYLLPTNWLSDYVYGDYIYFSYDDIMAWNGAVFIHFDPLSDFVLTIYEAKPASTPEPTTLVILGLGLAGVGLATRRRKK